MNYQQWNLIDIPSIFPPRFDRINIFYSNPDYYTEQKYKETLPRYNEAASQTTTAPPPIEWPVKTDDFFPYSDCPHCFWTGYFTSRAAFKRLERVASSFLLAVRQLDAMSLLGPATVHRPTEDADGSALFALEDALGIAQHHDAVAGTAKQHVADDYSMKLSTGMNRAALRAVEMLQKVMLKDGTGQTLDNLSYCPLLNETICPVSEVRILLLFCEKIVTLFLAVDSCVRRLGTQIS